MWIINIGESYYTVTTENMPDLDNKIIPKIKTEFWELGINILNSAPENSKILVCSLPQIMNYIFSAKQIRIREDHNTNFVLIAHKITKKIYGYYFLTDGELVDEFHNYNRQYFPIHNNPKLKQLYNILGKSSFDIEYKYILPRIFYQDPFPEFSFIKNLLEYNPEEDLNINKNISGLTKIIIDQDLKLISSEILEKYNFIKNNKLDHDMVDFLKFSLQNLDFKITKIGEDTCELEINI